MEKPLDRGSRARVLFLTQTGPVLGMAEMLRPLSWKEQPFRFLTMHEEDERKLRAATQPAAEIAIESAPSKVEAAEPGIEHESLRIEAAAPAIDVASSKIEESVAPQTEDLAPPQKFTPALDTGDPWIKKYRTAIYDTPPPQKRFFGKLFAGLAGGSLGLGAIVYALQHLLR